ncbi:HlyD family secretion protein [Arcicella rigui]|uniref:HlyD family efflux transporter periplasmic adaptor subunit n=1 Tax=Arcicella rigui TaxID=797020 RepID=A0ABU5QE10_9BACT|nr:HlyD family efflux transporter periplasmic adaptor subunit [Arcicella rigui]MEA5141094.1 HlyD family efflux transporter periplasmic adaptor subunit [Arcicella rigui]
MKNHLFILLVSSFLLSCNKAEPEQINKISTTSVATLSPAEIATNVVIAIGKVEPEHEIVSISAPVGGIIKNTLKKDGEQVQQGEVILELENDLELLKIKEIQTKMLSQQSQIVVEQTQAKEVEINLANKKSLLNKIKRLIEKGAETQQNYDDLITDMRVLEVSLERAKARIQLTSNQLNELNAQLKTAQTEAQKRQLKSPYNGVVLDMQISKGEALNQFSKYAEIAPQGSLIVRAEVDELFSTKVKTRQQVKVFFIGSEKVIATGEVTMVAPYLKKKSLFSEKADDQEDRRVREIHIALKETGNLMINSKVECKISL